MSNTPYIKAAQVGIDASTRRKLLLYAAGGLITIPAVASIASMVSMSIAKRRATKAIEEDNRKNGKSVAQLIEGGIIPRNAKILRDRESMLGAIDANGVKSGNGSIRRAIDRITAPMYIRQVLSGSNALYFGRENGTPVIGISPGDVGENIVRHEMGHYKADMLRGDDGNYLKEYYAAARRVPLSGIFNPDSERDSSGRMTRYGLESEAWDMSGVPERSELRRAALGTYKASQRHASIARAALLSMLAGSALGVYALKKYPLKWYQG